MKGLLDRMNLRPAERRLVVGVAAMLFFILNFWFVFPHFSDLQRVQNRIAKARKTKALFEAEIGQKDTYQGYLKQLESENFSVPAEEQNIHFANTRERVASESGVIIQNASRVQPRTNQFFVELTQTISLITKEPQLVSFLYNLGSGNSLIRVRDLNLRPDPSRQQLSSSVKLAASYQKGSPPRTVAAAQPGKLSPTTTNSATAPGLVLPARPLSQAARTNKFSPPQATTGPSTPKKS